MKIDSHQHFWHYNERDFAWISQDMRRIKHSFLPADLQDELKSSGFDGCVAVQARQSLEETRFLLDLANQYDIIKGVVGWVDLQSNKVRQQLEEFIVNPKFKGVRHVVQDEPDDRFILSKDFQKGIATLQDYDLTYDILVFPKHLRHVKTLVETFPQQPFVIDHLAKPDIKNHNYKTWLEDMTALSKHPNVWCKLSGMVTEANWNSWHRSDFAFYLDVVFDIFGDDRIMAGSDWPVCLVAASDYKSVMAIVADYVRNKGEEVEKKVLGLNAVSFYRI